jgi:hypothetical protein
MRSLRIAIPDKITPALQSLPVCAVDLGFSGSTSSCGFAVAPAGIGPCACQRLHFGQLVSSLHNWLLGMLGGECVVILEAPLSQHFQNGMKQRTKRGNPTPRSFEVGGNYRHLPNIKSKTCPWYSGTGAIVSLAVSTLLRALSDLTEGEPVTVHLVEGFHPRWLYGETEAWGDDEVAKRLIEGLRATPPREVSHQMTPPPYSHYRNAVEAAGLLTIDDHQQRTPLVVFASTTLFNARPS